MDSKTSEVMDILQEEAAEVIQAISKICRFGMDNSKLGTGQTNLEHLEEELGDVLAMIDILLDLGIVHTRALEEAKQNKKYKLKKWSNIYEQD